MNPVGGIGGGGSLEQVIALRQQIIDRSKDLQELHEPKPAAPAEGATGAPSFGDSLRTALENVNSVQAESGKLTAAYERGEETDIAKVMLARQEAGVAFEATLQVRNKLLSAYQETMRMGV
ncbi:MAG: flagellar hook-basal body complex protein FliE [Qipengyuania citrea]